MNMYYLIDWNYDGVQKVKFAYRSIKAARKELYKVLKMDGMITEGVIKEYRNNDPYHGKVIGKGYKTIFGPQDKGIMFKATAVPGKDRIYVRYANMDSNAKKVPVYDLKSDGSLGTRVR